MKTAKEKAREYVDEIYPYVKGYNYSHMSKEEWNACYEGYLAGYNEAMRWRDPKEKLPHKSTLKKE